MKKNRMMRLASGLLILTLLTTCMISGTFAKYVTKAEGRDTARVAKWGVTVISTGSLFAKSYDNKDGGNTAHVDGKTISVASANTPQDFVVAPGTKNDEGLTFAVTGTPEVSVKLDVKVTDVAGTGSAKDIFLAEGKYADLTTEEDEDTFDVTGGKYYPVKYTLTQTINGGTTDLVSGGTLTQVETALEGLSSGIIEPNTDLATELGTFTLKWEWDYPETENADTDKKDTLLGSLAANSNITAKYDDTSSAFGLLTANTDFSTTADIKIEISVTQID